MPRIHGETLLRAPPEQVFDFVADERNNYDPTVTHTELLTAEPIGIGTRFHSRSTRGGRIVKMDIEITDHDRPHRLASTTHLRGMDIHSTLTFVAEGEATRLQWTSDLRPHGLLKLATPLLGPVGRRQTAAIWTNLQRALDSPRFTPPGAPAGE